MENMSVVDLLYHLELETRRMAKPGRNALIRTGIRLGLDVLERDELISLAGHVLLNAIQIQNNERP